MAQTVNNSQDASLEIDKDDKHIYFELSLLFFVKEEVKIVQCVST